MSLRRVLPLLLLLTWAGTPVAAQQPQPVQPLPDGLVGEYFPPPTDKGLLVLYLGGSEGGVPRSGARDLNQQGFGVLALAYFKAPGVPATLEAVPLEYFDKAVSWLAVQPANAGRRVAVVGGSKGAEAALLLASRNTRICGVVAAAPSSVAWQGFNPQNPGSSAASWTLDGKAIPYARYDFSTPFKTLGEMYTRSLAKADAAAQIPVERIKAPVLLISGDADALWPSSAMGEALVGRAKQHGKRQIQHLAFKDAGHAAFGKPAPSVAVIPAALVAQSGGTAEGNQAARLASWPAAKAFLEKVRDAGC